MTKEIDIKPNLFDIVYSRLLLMHLPDPQRALRKMHALLKPGGKLLCEEPTANSLLTYPQNTLLERFNQIFISLGEKRGVDFNIGDKLPSLLINLDCRLLRPRFIQPIISIKMAKDFINLGAKEILSLVMRENIISESEGERLMEALQKMPEDELAYYAFPRQVQIAGIKI